MTPSALSRTPGAPHVGTSAGTPVGGVTAAVLHSHTEMPPDANGCAMWMCDCVTVPSKPS